MSDTPRRGRPPVGTKYPRRLILYATDQDIDLMQRLSVRMDRSQAGVLRHLLRKEAKELGMLPDGDEDPD